MPARSLRLVALLIALACACARGEHGAALAGTLRDTQGRPVVHARVIAHDGERNPLLASLDERLSPPAQTLSDENGAFRFAELSLVSVALEVDAGGFARTELWLPPGSPRNAVEVTIVRGGRIEGEVQLRDGKPDVGREVSAIRHVAERDGVTGIGIGSSITDAAGHFVFEHAPPGSYELSTNVATKGAQPVLGDLEELEAEVSVEDERSVHVVLAQPSLEPVRIDGSLTAGRAPIAGVRIQAHLGRGGPTWSTASDGAGRFDLALPRSGRWNLELSPPGGASTQRYVQIAPGETYHFAIDLPTAAVAGVVVDEQGRPCANVAVDVETLAGIDFDERDLQYALGQTDASGRFQFGFLQPGRYLARANAQATGKEWREHASASEVVELAHGATASLDLAIVPAGRVAGLVRDREGAPVEAHVFVVDESGRPCSPTLIESDDGGRFELDGIAPGSVQVFARTASAVSPWSDSLAVKAGEATSVELVLQPAVMLGIELTASGAELGEARLEVRDERGCDFAAFEADFAAGHLFVAHGRAALGPLPHGRYTLRAGDRAGRRASAELVVDGRSQALVALELARP